MNKTSFNKLIIQKQVRYFNSKLHERNNINQICKSLNISYSTIRDRFKRNHYVYNKLYNQYENTNTTIHLPDISAEVIDNIITKINSKQSTLLCEKKESNLTSRSFRIHSCVLDDFIKFCNNSKFTQQEILTQFIAEGLNKYQKSN